jgi:hypothetical protein
LARRRSPVIVAPVNVCHSGRLINEREPDQPDEIQITTESGSDLVNFGDFNEEFIKVCGIAEETGRQHSG